jgi:selenocysteine-specific translation elongation factor
VTVAVVGARDLAKEFGKRGTASDVTLYNAVHDDHALTLVEPTQFPEKFPPLLCAVAMGDRALFVVPALNREVAEVATVLDLSDVPVRLVLAETVGEEEARRAFKGMRFAGDATTPLDLVKLREELDGWRAPPAHGACRVPIDHAFPVKGVGTVALGVVRRGTLHAHDALRLYPSDRTVEVRSVQVHDIDVAEASVGERVGVALKGIEADQIDRGQTLGPPGSLTATDRLLGTEYRPCRYYRGDVVAGSHLHLAVGLHVVPVVVETITGDRLDLVTDRPVAFEAGETALLVDLSAPVGPRLVGRARLAGRT